MRETVLKYCAWLVHFYTATGAVAGLVALDLIARADFPGAFAAMGLALFVDSTDGPLARALNVRGRIPLFDGGMLDNVVDYMTYVAVPALLMLRAGVVADNASGLVVTSFVVLASAYGFCRRDAKTADHYFLGFPSYWNLVAFYLYCLRLPVLLNELVLGGLAVAVFLPIKFIYPNRTIPLRPLTLTYSVVWAIATAAMLPRVPSYNPILLYTSLSFIVYYFVMSFALYLHPSRIAARRAPLRAQLQDVPLK
ncbi:MAG TPA: hypothetical protein VJN94_10915 [Candidatus Binataceae bacterium]|nr:hypothetical protein [Candidatus Binataceae bacterium]